jgi:hypothetical protein
VPVSTPVWLKCASAFPRWNRVRAPNPNSRRRESECALEEAVARNSASAIDDTNFDTFFGYGGTACRNFTPAHDE